MLNRQNPLDTKAWEQLEAHYAEVKDLHLRDLFASDAARFDRFSLRFETLLLDYSKNRILPETMDLLLELAKECQVSEGIRQLFAGDPINETENRAVLHTALRNRSNTPVFVAGGKCNARRE